MISHNRLRLIPALLFTLAQLPAYGAPSVSADSIAAIRGQVVSRKAQIEALLKVQGADEDSLKKNKTLLIYDYLIQRIDELRTSQNPKDRAEAYQSIFDLDFALKTQGDSRFLIQLTGYLSALTKTWSIAKKTDAAKVAKPSELDARVWRPVTPSKVKDVADFFYNGGMPLQQGLRAEFPLSAVFRYKSIKKSQSTPKFEVAIEDAQGKKQEFTFKFGKETHADPTASALLGLLGYSTEVVKHVENFKVHFKSENELAKFKTDFLSYFDPAKIDAPFDINTFIISKSKDINGPYLVFRDGLLRPQIKELFKVGPWPFQGNEHEWSRPVRGLMVFNMWVGNTDAMASANNKVVLKSLKKDLSDAELFLIQSDSGRSFGGLIPEKLDQFSWDLVRWENADKVVFTHTAPYKNPLEGWITFEDAQWATRLIAGLSRSQIEQAVAIGHWPESVGKLLAEKLINRRNQLVSAFDLSQELGLMPTKQKLSTSDGRIQEGKVIDGKFAQASQDFGHYSRDLLKPISEVLKAAAASGVRAGIGGFSGHRYDAKEFGWDKGLFIEGLFNISRNVKLNPNPRSENERYLVEDVMGVGLRLGVGWMLDGDATLWTQYRMVHPVRSERNARQGQLIDFTLPFDVLKNQLPPRHVLMVETYLEGAGRLRTPTSGVISLGAEGSVSSVLLKRRLIDQKNPASIILQEDRSHYRQFQVRALVELFGLARIPLATGELKAGGRLDGRTYVVTAQKFKDSAAIRSAVAGAIKTGDFTGLEKNLRSTQIKASFQEGSRSIALPGVWSKFDRLNSEKIETKEPSKNGDSVIQHRAYGVQSWSWLDNGEENEVRIYSRAPDQGNKGIDLRDATVNLEFDLHDLDTRSVEIKNGYIPLVNSIAVDPDFFPLKTPETFSRNQQWGDTYLRVRCEYGPDAIQRFMTISRDEYWKALAETLGMSPGSLKTMIYLPPLQILRFLGTILPIEDRANLAIQKSFGFLAELKRAQVSNDPYLKLQHLTKALKRASYHNSYTFEPAVISALNRILGRDGYYIHAQLAPAPDAESYFPAGRSIDRSRGKRAELSSAQIILFPVDGIDLYETFNWMDPSSRERTLDPHLRPMSAK